MCNKQYLENKNKIYQYVMSAEIFHKMSSDRQQNKMFPAEDMEILHKHR